MTNSPEKIYNELLIAARAEQLKVPTDLKKKVRCRLKEVSDKKRSKFNYFLMPALSVAASLIIVFAFCFHYFNNETGSNQRYLVHQSTVEGKKPVTVKLVYDSTNDLKNVDFSLDLDEGVSFYSEKTEIRNKKSHEWRGDLKKGVNTIPFVVETNKQGRMKIIAKAVSGKFSHTYEIILEAKEKETVISMFAISVKN